MRDLSGQRFGRLMAVSPAGATPAGAYRWHCRCDCGAQKVVTGMHLVSGDTASCGCLRRDINSALHARHRMVRSSEYKAWQCMRSRCLNPRNPDYRNYGGRGVAVCEQWDSFESFLADMGSKPSRAHTIDRIDNNGNYEPSNCRWATRKQQNRNRRDNRHLSFRGQTKVLSEWIEELGLSRAAVNSRLHRGWSVERTFTAPLRITKQTKHGRSG